MTPQGADGRRKATEPAVVLRGPPRRLASNHLPDGVGSLATGRLPMSAVSVLVDGAVPERARIRVGRQPGARAQLRLRLASDTPPGRYEGAATVGDQTIPILIDVEPAARLHASPSRFETSAEPGGAETIQIELMNGGNLPVDIPARSSFCLFDGGGIDHAVWAALTMEPPEGKGRADLLLDDLAASHGGLVDVRVRDGAGSIAPGTQRACQVELRFSDRLRPGRRYAGAWEVAGLRVPIRVETPRPKPSVAKLAAAPRKAR